MAYVEGEIPLGNNNGTNYVYPYPPYGGYGNNGGFFGNGDGIWAILLFAMIFGWGNNGWGGSGFGGGNNMLYDINANTNRGFDQASIISGINGIQNSLSDASVARCNSTTELLQAINGVNSNLNQCLTKQKKPIKCFATNKIAVGTCAA